MSRAWGDNEFLTALRAPIEMRPEDIERAELLLSDYLHCVVSADGNQRFVTEPLTLATHLAKAASHGDLDDVNWQLLIHPGSIVNSAIFALFLTRDIKAARIVPAMNAGYSAANLVASIFQAGHSRKWHATATSGIFGATAASAYLLELDAKTTERALKLASASIGGGANASISRNGATRFTRIHATVMGVLATLEAIDGAPAPDEIIDGVGGLAARFDLIDSELTKPTNALGEISLRYFPWSGFSQGALVALQGALPISATEIRRVQIHTPAPIFPLVGSEEKGEWWSIAAAVKSTLLCGDPMVKNQGPAAFSVTTSNSGSSAGLIEISTESENLTIPFSLSQDFGVDSGLLTKKWSALAGAKSLDLSRIAHRIASPNADAQIRSDLSELLQLNR